MLMSVAGYFGPALGIEGRTIDCVSDESLTTCLISFRGGSVVAMLFK